MFDSSYFPKSLDEDVFNTWLDEGRASKIGYSYLLIIWDEFESNYLPVYTESRDKIEEFERWEAATVRESLVAVYDLYSESKIL